MDGDQFSYSAGDQLKGNQKTSAYGIDWNHPINDVLSTDVAYYNQGHFLGHDRDGAGISLLAKKHVLPKLDLSAGVGPWAFCDTIVPAGGKPSEDVHGVGAVATAAATYHLTDHLALQLRANYFVAKDSFSTHSLVAGIGYDFGADSDKSLESKPEENSGKNTITLGTGEDYVNTHGDVPSQAVSVEYRREMAPLLDLTVAGISEGNNNFAKREGIASELWLKKNYLDDRLSLSVGTGIYAGVDQKKSLEGAGPNAFAAGIVSTSASYKLTDNWSARLTWHRALTSYNRDSDIVVAGIGYQF